MSNLWLNVRFGTRHLQAGSPKWWSFRLSLNDYHVRNPPDTWFQVYELFGPWGRP